MMKISQNPKFNYAFTQYNANTPQLVLKIDYDKDEHKLDPLMEFTPNTKEILKNIVPMFITNEIYHALLEAGASELASRMTAMSAASNNAEEMITNLTVAYNKARQSAITNEIIEIVSGASALEG